LTYLPRLPIPAAPARHETVASYLGRLAALHGLKIRELWDAVSTTTQASSPRDVDAGRLAAVTGRPGDQLARALPELRTPAPDWTAWRHQPQPRCPRCDARHDGGQVQRLLPHHRYVCTRHRYWIGPPDAGQTASELRGPVTREIVATQHRHLRLVHRHGAAVALDAVLTGFLICGHLWNEPHHDWDSAVDRWSDRASWLIPRGLEFAEFSTSKLFAVIYPEAVGIAALIAAPAWRALAAGTSDQQQVSRRAIARRLFHDGDYTPPQAGDAILHWMKYDSWRPPSRPHPTFPDTRAHRSTRSVTGNAATLSRQERSAAWFSINRRGGGAILHHRHLRPVLVRDWSPAMDGINATIWASGSNLHPGDHDGVTV